MAYSDKDLFQIKQSVSLVDVVASRLGAGQKNGREWDWKCPFHNDGTPSFKVYQDDGIWLFKCFGCGKAGNVFQFIADFDRIPFQEAVEKVVSLVGWKKGAQQVDSTFKKVVQKERTYITFPLTKLADAERALQASRDGLDWLARRGISADTARRFHIGFVQSAAAVVGKHDWLNDGWLVFPTIEGETITMLKYRSLRGKKTAEGQSGILRKSGMETRLYNSDAIQPFDDVYVVEGEPDCLIMAQAGYQCVALPMSTYTMSPEMRDKILQANRIFLAGDSDEAGKEATTKLWNELRERTYRLDWPEGCKDANDAFLKACNSSIEKFQSLINSMKKKAMEVPIPNFYDLQASLLKADFTNPMDNPHRLHMPWPEIDAMAVNLPGSVVSMFATYSGSGKTTWVMAPLLEEAMKHGSIVLNYSAELSPDEYARLATAYLQNKDRLALTKEDFEKAAEKLEDTKFYVGYNPDANRIGLVLDMLEWAIRRLGANIVVLDHLHFLARGEKDEYKAQADAMQRIKNIAVKYRVIFIVVGQSRKAQPNQKGKPSETSDAKGSEAFISDASTAYHIHRDLKRDIDWDNPMSWPKDLLEQKTDIRLYKCRTKGPGNAVARLWFEGANGRFVSVTSRQEGN